jgi:quercetin dioxygenase-like cupin family protein
LLIPLLSDPLGYGWNLLGTAGYRIEIAVVGARFAWYTAVTAIVLGHMVAVYVAHVVALRELDGRRVALQSQYPMLVLMVGYTLVSLWIIAQPIVETTPQTAGAESSAAREPAFRQLLDNDRITIVEITLPPRFEGETHMTPSHEAAYVLEGELTVITGPGSVEAFGAGAVGWADKGTIHRSRNARDVPVRFLVVIPKER